MPRTQIKGPDIESTSLESKISNDIDFTKVETDRINLTSVNPADTATFFGTDESGNSTLHIRISNGTNDKIQIESWNGSAATSLMEVGQAAVSVQNTIICNSDVNAVNATFSGNVSASNITLDNDFNANNANVDAVNITSVSPADTATFFGTDDSGNSTLHIRIGNSTGDKIQIESWNGSAATSLMEVGQTTVTIKGDLVVSGTTTTVNSETLEVADNYIILNSGATGNPTLDAGIRVERGSESDAIFKWNETENKWEADNGLIVSGNIRAAVGSGLSDADSDTYITVEETSDEDVIHFHTSGSERVTIDSVGQLHIKNDVKVYGDIKRDETSDKYIFIPEQTNDNDFRDVVQLKLGPYLTLGNFGLGNGDFISFNSILDYSSFGGVGSEGDANKFIPHYEDGKGFIISSGHNGDCLFSNVDWAGSSARKKYPDDFTHILMLSSEGNVGIRNPSPSVELDVNGDVKLKVGGKFRDADGDTYITVEETADKDAIHFYTGGNERIKIDENGFLQIFSNISDTVKLYCTESTAYPGFMVYNDMNLRGGVWFAGSETGSTPSDMRIGTVDSRALHFLTGNNVRITIDSNGILNIINNLTWGGDHSSSGYFRIGNIQVCWGSRDVTLDTNRSWTAFEITLPAAYLNTSYVLLPVMSGYSGSTSPDINKWRNAVLVTQDNLKTTTKVTVNYLTDGGSNCPSGSIRVKWISIGVWQ